MQACSVRPRHQRAHNVEARVRPCLCLGGTRQHKGFKGAPQSCPAPEPQREIGTPSWGGTRAPTQKHQQPDLAFSDLLTWESSGSFLPPLAAPFD